MAKRAQTPSGQLALLLDCGDNMAEAFAAAGYEVARGALGVRDGTKKLPMPLYEADVVVQDAQEVTWPERGEGQEGWLEGSRFYNGMGNGRPYEAFYHYWELYVEDLNPAELFQLSRSWRAADGGTVFICFVNRAMLPACDAAVFCSWLFRSNDFELQPCRDNPRRCRVTAPEVWRDFFDAVRSPVVASIPSWSCARLNATPVLANRAGDAHAIMRRYGDGAFFILPEFLDNAAAAVRLMTEIWPKLSEQTGSRAREAGGSESAVPPACLEPSPTVEAGQRPVTDAFKEHPKDVLMKFKKHVESFPEHEGPRVAWKMQVFGFLGRWGDAVNARPELRRRFVQVAGLHRGKKAVALYAELENRILAACRTLRGQTTGRHVWDMPEFPTLQGEVTESRSLTDAEAIDLFSEVVSREWDVKTWDEGLWVNQRMIAGRLAWYGDVVALLEDLHIGLRAGRCPELDSAISGVKEAVARLRHLLVEGHRGDVWGAADLLLKAYHAHNPRADPAFGYDIGRPWALALSFVGEHERSLTEEEGMLRFAQDALEKMEIVMEWLSGAEAALPPEAEEPDSAIATLERQTPLFDRDSGEWVKNALAARLENLETRTLATYRSRGIQNPDGTLGRDRDGRVWRRSGTPRSHPWYLRSTLKAKRKHV